MTKEQIPLFDDLPVYLGPVKKHPLYGVLSNMKSRCYNPKVASFKYYGARGITVCDEWRASPWAFIAWALSNGWQPGLQIDRRDNDGPYSPENCRFVTNRENSCNRRDTHRLPDGTPVVHVSLPPGVSRLAVRCRIRAGMSPEKAVAMPLHGYRLSDGTPLLEAARSAGLKPPTVYSRIRSGWSVDDAATIPKGGKRPAATAQAVQGESVASALDGGKQAAGIAPRPQRRQNGAGRAQPALSGPEVRRTRKGAVAPAAAFDGGMKQLQTKVRKAK